MLSMDLPLKVPTHDNLDQACVLAVDVGGTKMAGAIVSPDGTIIQERTAPTRGASGTGDPLVNLIALLHELQSAAGLRQLRALGIALGIPGVTDHEGSSVRFAPGLGWHDVNIGALLGQELNLPVWADNDVNVFLRGEVLRGSMRQVRNGLGITIGTGIGASLLLEGRIYYGSHGGAGEIGYWACDLPANSFHKEEFGQLERFASGPGMARRAQALLAEDPQAGPILRELVAGALERITAESVCSAAQLGDEHCQLIVDETARALGLVLANLSAVLDVERIVVGGGVAQAGELLLTPMRETIRRIAPYPPEVVQSALGYRASMIGAAAGFWEKHSQLTGQQAVC
jgi:glucokinase